MTDINVTKFPIVVVGTGARCGSTPFVMLLAQKLNLQVFFEPWCSRICGSEKKYLEHYKQYMQYRTHTKKYIVKFWLNELEHRSPYLEEMQNGYKILLMRKDVVGQIASWYIANYIDKFHTTKDELQNRYTIKIEPKQISILIQRLSNNIFLANHLRIFEQRIYYEDIDFSELKSNFVKTNQPDNINEIRQEIESQMRDSIPCHW